MRAQSRHCIHDRALRDKKRRLEQVGQHLKIDLPTPQAFQIELGMSSQKKCTYKLKIGSLREKFLDGFRRVVHPCRYECHDTHSDSKISRIFN